MKKFLIVVLLPMFFMAADISASDTLSVQDSLNIELTRQQIKQTQTKKAVVAMFGIGLAVLVGLLVGNAVGEGVSK